MSFCGVRVRCVGGTMEGTMKQRDYDSTVARMAGNIAAGFVAKDWHAYEPIARLSVEIARAVINEVRRTEPKEKEN